MTSRTRRPVDHYLERMDDPMTLTWGDIDERYPDAGVLWDRDVAPTLDWEPRFVERDGVLWAEPATTSRDDFDHALMKLEHMAWYRGRWMRHADYDFEHTVALWRTAGEQAAGHQGERRSFFVVMGQSNATVLRDTAEIMAMHVATHRESPRQRLRGTRAQRKRKRAALIAQR